MRLREKYGGKVTVITMGPPQAEDALREAISLGADEAILLSDRAFAGSDTWATSYVLSKAVAKIANYDLIICGRQTLDGDTGQVGPELSEMLKIPFIAYVSKVEEIKDKHIRVQRMIEEGHEDNRDDPARRNHRGQGDKRAPTALAARHDEGEDAPRYPCGQPQTSAPKPDKAGIPGSPTRVVKIFFPKREHKSEMLQGTVEEQVEKLAERLEKII